MMTLPSLRICHGPQVMGRQGEQQECSGSCPLLMPEIEWHCEVLEGKLILPEPAVAAAISFG